MVRLASKQMLLMGGALAIVSAALAWDAAAQPQPGAGQPIPDFSSDLTQWIGGIGVDFLPVEGSPMPNRQDPAHPFNANNSGRQPNYRIADLSNPNLKQWAKDIMKKDNDEVLAGKIAFTPRQSCLPAGVPGFILYGGGNVYFVQSPKEVSMIFDSDSQIRRVYLDVPHSENPKPSWYGESVGHYEGDTLVVDTIGQNTKTVLDAYRTPHSEKLHTVERWRMIDGGKTLEVVVTIDDPETFNQSWQGRRLYRRGQAQMSEQYCAENNFFFDYGIPKSEKPDF